MNIDMLIDGILDSYDRYGGINRSGSEDFPNRQKVVEVLSDLQCLIFPGFKDDEEISPTDIRYITGCRVNHVIAVLTKEIQKALFYTVCKEKGTPFPGNNENSKCFKTAIRPQKTEKKSSSPIRRYRQSWYIESHIFFTKAKFR